MKPTVVANLRRRYIRFNKSNPALAIEMPVIQSARDLSKATRQLEKQQSRAKFAKAKEKAVNTALELQIKFNPSKIKGVKTLDRLRAAIKQAKSFNTRKARFMKRVVDYNNKVHSGDLNGEGDRFYYNPHTPSQLKEAYKLLNKLEKGQAKSVRKELGVEGRKRLSTVSIELDTIRSDLLDKPNFRDQLYYDRAVREAANSQYPELAALFKQLGWKGVIALAEADFVISDFAESSNEGNPDFDGDTIRDTLSVIAPNMPKRYQQLITRFLKDN